MSSYTELNEGSRSNRLGNKVVSKEMEGKDPKVIELNLPAMWCMTVQGPQNCRIIHNNIKSKIHTTNVKFRIVVAPPPEKVLINAQRRHRMQLLYRLAVYRWTTSNSPSTSQIATIVECRLECAMVAMGARSGYDDGSQ